MTTDITAVDATAASSPALPPGDDAAPPAAPPRRSFLGRLWRGRPEDPAWARPALLGLLLATAVLYLWNLSINGWANSYYAAAIQAGTESWKAFFFGSFDAANLITVDKTPGSLWVMELSTRIFGMNSWAMLAPQALLGVASVGVLHATVRRVAGPAAGLIAGATLALTPVAVLMFRFNNPDALLVLMLTLGAYATVRAMEKGSWRWLVLAGTFVGLGFLAKMMQAFLVIPAFAGAYLVAAPIVLHRRILHVLSAAAAVVVAGGWWVAIVELWPASSRPYIGGSQTNSVLELMLGYNGLGRLTGNETGSVTGGGGGNAGPNWGSTGLTRLFTDDYGGQIAWLLPAALVLMGALLWVTRRAARTDTLRASTIVWGGWLVVTALVISLGGGIIHTYYTVALAPAIGALVGLGAVTLWRQRGTSAFARYTLAGTVAVAALTAFVLLERTSDWNAWLGPLVLILGAATAGVLALPARLGTPTRWAGAAVASAGLVVALVGPAAYAVDTVSTAHTGSLPTAGPSTGFGFGNGGTGFGRGGGQLPGGGQFPGGASQNGQTGQGGPGGGGMPGGQAPGGTSQNGGQLPGQGGTTGGTTGGFGGTVGGGLINGSTPSDALVQLLEQDASSYTWVAATVGANNASGYQLATGDPVMAIGGFNGSDPAPTLEEFQQYVAQGKVHYFIGGGGFGGQNGGSEASSEIATWVEQNFTAQTVDGVTVYDLSSGATPATAA
ncbi:glycosyltransferase family 39 protein [Demequina soli]|uniref:glycosyltransferase family 39 protein n=1 Tax=Demequina soli TaxID=1638987 RepID=UPI0007805193|nr:glycosyltransferase family 39 protein [Demequina soli]